MDKLSNADTLKKQMGIVADLRAAKNNLGDLAYEHLLKAILSGALKPGDKLRPQDIAAAMGLSPTPVKHALARLAGEGLVDFAPGQGPYVSRPTISAILDLIEIRFMFEVHAIEEGIERVDSEFLNRLEYVLREHELAFGATDATYESHLRLAQTDRDFHLHHLSLWPNDRIQLWYRQLNVQIRSFQLAHTSGYGRKAALVEHRDIYEALKSRDVSEATKAVRRHLKASKEWFLARTQSVNPQ